jgi:hypothetical protein
MSNVITKERGIYQPANKLHQQRRSVLVNPLRPAQHWRSPLSGKNLLVSPENVEVKFLTDFQYSGCIQE